MIPSYQHRSSHLRAPRPEATADSVAADKVHAQEKPATVLDLTATRYEAARKRGQAKSRRPK